jgi:hypothetical protein
VGTVVAHGAEADAGTLSASRWHMANEQHDVIELLQRPETHAATAVERIDTHSAIVFLAGSRA